MTASLAQTEQAANALDDVRNWQQFQTIYHKITGKKERLSKVYTEPYQFTYKDIEDLHHRILQAAEPYPISARNESVTLAYNDNSTFVHSSFDRFKIHADVGNTAIKGITLEYNIAINATQSTEVNSYKVTITLLSGVAVFAEVQEEVPKVFWHSIGYITGRANVEFVDYAIAQNFMGVINAWFAGRLQAPKKKPLEWIQAKSQYIPRFTRIASLLVCAALLLNSITVPINLGSNQSVVRFLILGSTFIWIFTEIGYLIGRGIETSVDRIWKIAFISLNEGDRKLIEDTRAHNRSCFISVGYKAICFLLACGVSVLLKEALDKLFQSI